MKGTAATMPDLKYLHWVHKHTDLGQGKPWGKFYQTCYSKYLSNNLEFIADVTKYIPDYKVWLSQVKTANEMVMRRYNREDAQNGNP